MNDLSHDSTGDDDPHAYAQVENSPASPSPAFNGFAASNLIEMSSDEAETLAQSTRLRKPRRGRKRTNWLFLSLVMGVVSAYLIYVFVVPQVMIGVQRWRSPNKLPDLDMKWWERNILRTCEFVFVTWFFYLGASIGSFLNVVAWRMPERRTIVFGGSKCPFCDTRLRFIDNTPIIGWLLLQGRCRTCHLPIAPRYLWIEIAVGLAFVWIGVWQLVGGGANLPNWSSFGLGGIVNTVYFPRWDLIAASMAHAGLFAVLIMLATANTGRKAFPWFPLMVMAVGLGSFRLINPALDFVKWYEPFGKFEFSKSLVWVNPLLSMTLGGMAGSLLGLIFSFLVARHQDAKVRWHWGLQCFLIGSVLGWQSISTIVLMSLPVHGLIAIVKLCRGRINAATHSSLGLSVILIGTTVIHHSFWRQIAHLLRIV